jgi:hypothetical protein
MTEAGHAPKARSDGDRTSPGRTVRPAATKSHGCHSPPTMLRKQVSGRLDSLDCPSWPPRRSRSSKLEERPNHGPDPSFRALHANERPVQAFRSN